MERQLVSSTLEVRLSRAWTLQLGGALLLSGDIRLPGTRFAFAGGTSFSVSGSYRLLEEKGAFPFVGLTTTLGYATAKTHERFGQAIGYNAFDLRIGGIVGKLSQGAVDAGFVYATDVVASEGALRAIPLPASLQPVVAYGAAVVKGSKHPAAARAFIAGLLHGPGQRALREAGFLPPPAP